MNNARVIRSEASITELLLRVAVRRYFSSLYKSREVAGYGFTIGFIGIWEVFAGCLVLLLVLGGCALGQLRSSG